MQLLWGGTSLPSPPAPFLSDSLCTYTSVLFAKWGVRGNTVFHTLRITFDCCQQNDLLASSTFMSSSSSSLPAANALFAYQMRSCQRHCPPLNLYHPTPWQCLPPCQPFQKLLELTYDWISGTRRWQVSASNDGQSMAARGRLLPRLHIAATFNSLTFFGKVSVHPPPPLDPCLLSNTHTNRVSIIHDWEKTSRKALFAAVRVLWVRAVCHCCSNSHTHLNPFPTLPRNAFQPAKLHSHLFLEQEIVLAIYVRPCCSASLSAGKCQKAAATTAHTQAHTSHIHTHTLITHAHIYPSAFYPLPRTHTERNNK